jgi:hypothetical protein
MDEATSLDADDEDAVPSMANDPYSNIESAFGNYMADEPKPMVARKGPQGDLDDLFF